MRKFAGFFIERASNDSGFVDAIFGYFGGYFGNFRETASIVQSV